MHSLVVETLEGARKHRQLLADALSASQGTVRIASAYVTEASLFPGRPKRKTQLLTSLSREDVVFGATSLIALESLIGAGVQCRILSQGPRLHAKVYVFGNTSAVVTSANLTRNALDANIEVGVSLTGDVVRELADWFDRLWKDADRLNLADVAKWKEETESLRRACAELRRKARSKDRLPRETMPGVRSAAGLHELFNTAKRILFATRTVAMAGELNRATFFSKTPCGDGISPRPGRNSDTQRTCAPCRKEMPY
jgi:hypothetical protein